MKQSLELLEKLFSVSRDFLNSKPSSESRKKKIIYIYQRWFKILQLLQHEMTM